ncbi:MAG TPA: hypothetical protein VGH16_01280, partial [Candidatus Binatia bacterium]
NVFLDGDVDREIVSGASRAVITALNAASPTNAVTVDVLVAFAGSPIAAGSWFLDKSPTNFIDPNKKSPVDAKVTVNFRDTTTGAGAADGARAADAPPVIVPGKFIKLYGGLIEINEFINAQQVKGIIRTILSKATAKDPDKIEGGAWTLNVASWSSVKGFPSALTFFQGRLFHGGTASQPTTFWGSASDDYENYGVGSLADDALEYTIASRQFNKIQWLLDLGPMLIGTLGSVFSAKAPGNDQVLGGDVMPFVRATNTPGAAAIQPVTVGTRAIYIDASQTQAIDLGYSFNDDTLTGEDLTLLADHIAGTGFAQEQIAYARNPNSIMYFVRKDGQLACLTYYRLPENVVAWARRTTDGAYESVCAIPHPDGNRDQVWTIVNRTIGGLTKRYVEYFDDGAAEFAAAPVRPWTELHTDCALIYNGTAVTNVTGLAHLEGKNVDVIADGSYKGARSISGGTFTQPLSEPAAKIEIGLHYDSKLVTMRPALQDSMIEGTQKMWDRLSVRLLKSIGCRVNGQETLADIGGEAMDAAPALFTGDKPVTGSGWDDQGRITIEQKLPYPQIVLAVYGRLNLSSLD